MKNKRIRIIGYLLTIVSLLYIFCTLFASRKNIVALENLNTILLVCGVFVIPLVGIVYFNSNLLKMILEFFAGKKLEFSEFIGIFIKANICRYLPGNVMQFVARNIYAKKIGISQAQMALGSFFEVLLVVIVSTSLTLIFAREVFITMLKEYVPFNLFYILLFGLILFALILLLLARRIKHLFIVYFNNIKILGIFPLFAKSICIICLVHIVSGVVFYYLLHMVTGAEYANIFLIISAYIVAWLIGFITPGSPGGLGVKEAILSFLLSDVYGSAYVLVCALLFRLITVTADAVAFFLWVTLSKLRLGVQNPK